MRRLCLFTGGFAAAAGLYLFLLHGAPGVLLAALAAVCALLFLLRRPILRRAAVCVLGLLAGFAWCRGYEALFLRPFADLSGKTAAFSAQALAALAGAGSFWAGRIPTAAFAAGAAIFWGLLPLLIPLVVDHKKGGKKSKIMLDKSDPV